MISINAKVKTQVDMVYEQSARILGLRYSGMMAASIWTVCREGGTRPGRLGSRLGTVKERGGSFAPTDFSSGCLGDTSHI